MKKIKSKISLVSLVVICSATYMQSLAQNTYASSYTKTDRAVATLASNMQNSPPNERVTLLSSLQALNKAKGIYFLFSKPSFGEQVVTKTDDYSKSAEYILGSMLEHTGLTYKKVNAKTFAIISEKEKFKISANAMGNPGADGIMQLRHEQFFDIITGKITDGSGNPVAGASVSVKGKNGGVSTDAAGQFTIDAKPGDILIISSVGFSPQELTLGRDKSLTIQMSTDNKELNEVVVTALGIKQSAKSLTYATQKVNNSDLTTVKDASFVNSLTGKVAGVTITKSASGIGGSTRVIIRGNKSTRENQPLYVVDGVPLVNFSPAQPNDSYGQSLGFVGVDGGDGISNINPDDIESVTVLKGASSATLYGSKGANGVILITTKKGKAGAPKISFSSDLTFDKPLYYQPLQFKYGQTVPASAGTPGKEESWGGVVNAPDHVKPFFNTGITTFNSVSLSGGSEKSQTYASYSYTDNKGMMPTSGLKKHNINFHQINNFYNDRFSTDLNVLLINQNSTNRPVSGLYDNPLYGLYAFPRGLNFNQYKDFEVPSTLRNTMQQNWWNTNVDSNFVGDPGNQNPYWLLNRNKSTNSINRLYSNLSLKYKISDGLSIQARGNVDKSINNIDLRTHATTNTVLTANNGSYFYNETKNTQYYGDLLLTANKDLSKDVSISATAGASITDSRAEGTNLGTSNQGDGLRYANVFTLANILPNALSLSSAITHTQTQAVFATTSFSFKNYLFLDLTGRNDWSSTLAFTPSEKKGFFYYSVGANAIVSDMLKLPQAFSFWKIRGSYSGVGNAVNAYSTNLPSFSLDHQNGVNATTRGPFPGTFLEPEDNRSFEIGTEMRFLRSRIGLDLTYYKNNNYNQYIEVGAPAGSGFDRYFLNGGNVQNTGVELSINAIPVRSTNFSWNTTVNFARNKNEIISLSNDKLKQTADSYTLTGRGNLLYASYLVKGGSYGDIYARYFKRAANGDIIVDADNKPIAGNNPDAIVDKDLKKVGNPNPDYTVGWNNNFNFKRLSLDFLFDGRFGGEVMSITQAVLDGGGFTKATSDARDAGGVIINAQKEDGSKVTGPIDAKTFYQAVGKQDGIGEYYIYDATAIRLRELALGYQIPIKNTKVINSLKFTIIGRNLFFVDKKAPFDPEVSMSTSNSVQGTDAFGLPTSRSIGFSLKAGF